MKDKTNLSLVPQEVIENKILLIRGQKVMLDKDLAQLYKVETKQLTRQVRRNIERFPNDFMFQLTKQEFNNLMCQIGTSSWGGTRKMSFAFTEQGVAMLSSVLHSKRAIQVNIQIMRAFTKLKYVLSTHTELLCKIQEHDHQIKRIFELLKQLLTMPEPEKPKRKIGFNQNQ